MYTGKLITRCAVMLLIASAGSVMAVDHQVIPHHLPDAAVNAQATGRLPADQRLTFSISLPLRNQDALTNLLAEIYNPASPKFHHFLSSAQFTLQFGPKLQDYQDLIAFAQANGFTIQHTHPGQTMLLVNAAVSDVERAFGVTMRTYKHPTENREFHAPDGNLTVNLSTRLLDIHGLSDFEKPHPMCSSRIRASTHSTSAGTPDITTSQPMPQSGSGPSPYGGYIGSDFRNAYVPNCSLTGTGQAVGLLEMDGFYLSDISNYVAQAHLPQVNVTTVLMPGATGIPSADNNAVTEVSLDIEMAISMAPGLSKVIVYEAPNASGDAGAEEILQKMYEDYQSGNGALQLSSSWSFSSGFNTAMDNTFLQMASAGMSFFQASGDSCAYETVANLVKTPVDDPWVTSVGGTTLSTSSPGGPWQSEQVWNWGYSNIWFDATFDPLSVKGSGGGISPSSNYPIPSWQQYPAVIATNNHASSSWRNFPDVALTADNVFVLANNGEQEIEGGTSCAAPLWAGFAALANQQAAANGLNPVGFLNPALYAIGATNPSLYASAFHDITSGSNITLDSSGLYSATHGYDLCTGWGTPNGTNLINALSPPHPLLIFPFVPNYSFIYQPSTGVIPANQTFTVTNTTGNALTLLIAHSSTNNWLVVSANGSIAAGASTNVIVSVDPLAITNFPPGTYAGTLTFKTMAGVKLIDTQIRTVALNMEMPTVVDGGFETATHTNIWPWQTSSSNTYFMITNTVVTTNESGHVFTNFTGTNLTLFLLAQNNGALLYPGLSDVPGSKFVHFGGSNGFAMGGVGNGQKGYLYQQMEIATNQDYLLSFWVNNPVDCGDTPAQNGHYTNLFQVIWNSNVVFTISNMLVNTAWKNYQRILQAPQAQQLSLLQFVGMNGLPTNYTGTGLPRIGAFGLDDVSLTSYPASGGATQEVSSAGVKLSWLAYETSITYQLQHTTNLAKSVWTNVGPSMPGVNGTITTNLMRNGEQNGFYRVLMSAPSSN